MAERDGDTVDLHIWIQQLSEMGWIQPICFGMSREEVERILGAPSDEARGFRNTRAPMILKYGKIELHFGPCDEGLELIYSDDPDGVVRLCIRRNGLD